MNQKIGSAQAIQSGAPKSGPCQPPRKSVTVMAEMLKMLAYSARKNKAKRNPEYSVW